MPVRDEQISILIVGDSINAQNGAIYRLIMALRFVYQFKPLMMKKSCVFLLGSALISNWINAYAQGKDTLHTLPAIEVRALRAASDAPFAKTEISKKEISENNLGQDLPYLLQQTTSAVATSDAGAGVGYTSLRIRGTDATRINITLNGVPVNDAESQGTFFVNMPDLASSTNSIQIQRGVGTSTNGSGAFGATMSISSLAQEEKPTAEVAFNLGSFNTQKYTLKAATGLMKGGFQFDVRMSKIFSDGYIQRSASDLKSLQVVAGWKASNRTSFRLMILTGKEKTGQAWNGVPQDSLSTNRTFNELGLKKDGTYYNNQTDNYQQDYYQFFADHQINTHWAVNVGLFLTRGKGYYEEYKTGERFSNYGLNNFISGSDTIRRTDLIRQLWLDNKFYGTVFSLIYSKARTTVSLGGSAAQYEGRHYGLVKWAQYNIPADYQWYHVPALKQDANMYAKLQQGFSKLTIFADVQLRYVNYQLDGFRKNPSIEVAKQYLFFNPKAGFSYKLHSSSSSLGRIYASIAIAGKEPNRDDFEAGVSELPKPERLYDYEAGIDWTNQQFHATVNGYYMQYKDQLVLTGKINDVGAYTRTNVPNSFRLGLEMSASAKLLQWLHLQGNVTVSQNKILDFTEYLDDYDHGGQAAIIHGTTDIAFSPGLISAASLTVIPFYRSSLGRNFEIELLNKYVGKQYLDNTSNTARMLSAYNINDVRLRYHLKMKRVGETSLFVTLNNVFNQRYESNGYSYSFISGGSLSTQNYMFPQAGMNWLAGFSVKFQ